MDYEDIFVSVIVPAYNSEATIDNCLISLLNQDYPVDKYEIIVVDDGSPDKTKDRIQKYPVSLFESVRLGPGAARNKGVSLAKGEMIFFLDADCEVKKDWISAHLGAYKKIKNRQGITGCLGGSILLPRKANSLIEICDYYSSWYEQPRLNRESKYEYLPTTNFSVSKKVFDEVGGFDERLKCGEDVEFGARLRKSGYILEFEEGIEVFHYGRKRVRDYLYHHYQWGLFVAQFRKFGSGLKYSWLFFPGRVYALIMSPFICLGYTLYVIFKWISKGKFLVVFLSPMIFISKVYFSFGVVKNAFERTEKI